MKSIHKNILTGTNWLLMPVAAEVGII